jgi:hypothetical protein
MRTEKASSLVNLPRLLIIGDMGVASNIDYVVACVRKLSGRFDVCVSGDRLSSLEALDRVARRCMITPKNSEQYISWVFTASTVFLLDDSVNMYRHNSTQNVVSLGLRRVPPTSNTLSDYQRVGSAYQSISTVVTFADEDNPIWLEGFGVRSLHLRSNRSDTPPRRVVDAIDFRTATSPSCARPVVVVAKSANEIADSVDNILPFLEACRTQGYSNVFLFCEERSHDKLTNLFTATISLSSPHGISWARNIIRTSNAIVVPCGAYGKDFTRKHLAAPTGSQTEDNLFDVGNPEILKQFFLNSSVEDFVDTTCNLPTSTEALPLYRSVLMSKYRESKTIQDTVVSVIVCTFNTDPDLLLRSLRSALDSPHPSIEVVLVDDGSDEPLDKWLRLNFKDDLGARLKYIRQENQGLGPARNTGVRHASGEYVTFLDADDAIIGSSIPVLLAHASLLNLDCVVGVMVICDPDLKVLRLSLPTLFGQVYRSYSSSQPDNASIHAQMGQAKLVKRTAFEQYDLWFEPGYYEDSYFSARLYTRVSRYHFINEPTYYWVKYPSNDTISSTVDLKHFEAKVHAVRQSLTVLPHESQRLRVAQAISNDFAPFLTRNAEFTEQERPLFLESLMRFAKENEGLLTATTDMLPNLISRLARQGDTKQAAQFISNYPHPSSHDGSQDDYVISTHYHLLISLLLILERRPRRARLFLYTEYQSFGPELIATLRQIHSVVEVVAFGNSGVLDKLANALRQGTATREFYVPDVFNSCYDPTFSDCEPEDTVFFFQDNLPVFYYLCRRFTHLYRLEDAYDSFSREVRFSETELSGVWGDLHAQISDIYPKMQYRSSRLEGIWLFSTPEGVPADVVAPVTVLDYWRLRDSHNYEYMRVVQDLYQVTDLTGDLTDAVLLLTQPLARIGLCTMAEQERLYRNLTHGWGNRRVVVKPHPADTMPYANWGLTVLDKNTPSEVLELANVDISAAVTFGSSAIETLRGPTVKIRLFDDQFEDKQEITYAIRLWSTEEAWRDRLAEALGHPITDAEWEPPQAGTPKLPSVLAVAPHSDVTAVQSTAVTVSSSIAPTLAPTTKHFSVGQALATPKDWPRLAKKAHRIGLRGVLRRLIR